jgi:ParB-like chromosome segregation protein Spo0J
MNDQDILTQIESLFQELENLDKSDKIKIINSIRLLLHEHSPFKNEPVDCVQWILAKKVVANDYNPNVVAPPEMELLRRSIEMDGYTQPIVAWTDGNEYEVVDGFHRNRVGIECKEIKDRLEGYLPLTIIKKDREERGNRIAATIRHNRARGKHTVDSMSDIVIELKKRNWSEQKIGKELGMDPDEILRLCQITGLAELFTDQEFSKAWDIEGFEDDFVSLSDDVETYGDEVDGLRTVNTSDKDRIFHKWKKWECHKAGFYDTTKDGMTKKQCEQVYYDFLSNTKKFAKTLELVITEWKFSCEHYLTNKAFNRIAWLGQAAVCYATGVPSVFRGGWFLLSEDQQKTANETALVYLNKWLRDNKRDTVTMEEGISGNQSDLY